MVSRALFVNYILLSERTNFDYNYIVQPIGSPYKTSLTIECWIPSNQKVEYIPGTLETLKFALI